MKYYVYDGNNSELKQEGRQTMKKLKPLNISLMDAVKLACRGGLSKAMKIRVADRIEKGNAFPNWVKRLREEAGAIKNGN